MLSLLLAFLAVLFGLVLLLFAVIYGGMVFGAVGIAAASRGWPAVAGRVEVSKARANRPDNGMPGYRYVVVYRYTVDGEEWDGDMVAAGKLFYATRRWVEQRLAPYPVGARVTVYYDPEDPETAVLEPGWSREGYYFVATLLMVVALGAAALAGGAAVGWRALFG